MHKVVSRVLAACVAVAALLSFAGAPARAESGECRALRAQIANAAGGEAGNFRAAAARQRREIDRTEAYAQSLGCDDFQIPLFSKAPPAQCKGIMARLSQMRANLSALERRSGDDFTKVELQSRYDLECRDRDGLRGSRQPRSVFEEMFGVAPPEGGSLREAPVSPPGDDDPFNDRSLADDEKPAGGTMAVCVRKCDGGFFPVSYSARRGNLDDLASLCHALCPGAEAELYTRSLWKPMDEAESIDGASYATHPNAFRFQTIYDKTCSCKPPDKSWASALEDAEKIVASAHTKDVVISAEEADKMSRPAAKTADSTRGKGKARPAAPPVGEERPVAAGEKPGEVFREVTGADGVKRRVRNVAPTL